MYNLSLFGAYAGHLLFQLGLQDGKGAMQCQCCAVADNATHTGTGSCSDCSTLNPAPVNAQGKLAQVHGLLATHLEDKDEASGSWFQSSPALAAVPVWGMNHQV